MRLPLSIGDKFSKKSLGQNFITDDNFLPKLNSYINFTKNSTIIEIGPGKGALTNLLVQKNFKEMYLIEKDNNLAQLLIKKYENSNNIKIIHDDALIHDFNYYNKKNNVLIYGNLPFNISTKLLIRWLSSSTWPSFFNSMILMFQKEVADRIVAKRSTIWTFVSFGASKMSR